jgi:hypothetical protein
VSGGKLPAGDLLAFSTRLHFNLDAGVHGLCVRLAVFGGKLPVWDLLALSTRLHFDLDASVDELCVRLRVLGRQLSVGPVLPISPNIAVRRRLLHFRHRLPKRDLHRARLPIRADALEEK